MKGSNETAENILQKEPDSTTKKKWIGTLVRAGVSVGAIAFILWQVDLADLANSVAHLDPLWMLATVGAVLLAVGISALKWGMLLKGLGHTLSFWRLVRHYFVGFFFNNFLPTSVGGDVVRVWEAGRDIDDMPASAASVIAERLVALLVPTALIGVAFVDLGIAPWAIYLTIFVPVVLALVLGLIFLNPRLSEKAMSSAAGKKFGAVTTWVAKAAQDIGALIRKPLLLVKVAFWTVAFQVCVALVNYCIFRALGSPVGIMESIVYSSVAFVVTMLPVSISGHGVREMGYVYFFGLAGVSEPNAVAASLLFFAVVSLTTLPGGLFFVSGKKKRESYSA